MLFKTDFIEIKYFTSNKLVETTWVGLAPVQEYRNALKGALAILKTHDVKRWIGDYRLAQEPKNDEEWTLNEWAPAFLNGTTKLEKMAKVNSVTLPNNARNISEKLNLGNSPFLYQEFDDYEEAKKWITT